MQNLPHLSIVEAVALLSAMALQATRMLDATRPYWTRLPARAQVWLMPAVPIVAYVSGALTGVHGWADLGTIIAVSGCMMLPGAPSNRSTEPLQTKELISGAPSIHPPAGG